MQRTLLISLHPIQQFIAMVQEYGCDLERAVMVQITQSDITAFDLLFACFCKVSVLANTRCILISLLNGTIVPFGKSDHSGLWFNLYRS